MAGSNPGTADGVAQHLGHGDGALAVGAELRPEVGDGRIEVELAAVLEHQHHDGGHGLGDRPAVDDGVALPRPAGAVGVAGPQVDDGLAVRG